LVFRHADGTTYGRVVHHRAAAIHEEAFRALRSLGFRESEARRALESVRARAHEGDPSIQGILRQALAWLASDRQPPRMVVEVR
jgi:Holliday junction resolvasome RuvABC DNA-binding subunit